VKLTLSNGTEFAGGPVEKETEVYCSVEGGSSNVTTTYIWINTTNSVVLSSSTNVTIPVGDYTFICTANSTVSCGVRSTKTCGDLEKAITGTVPRPPGNPERPCYKRPGCVIPAVVVPVVVVVVVVIVIVLYLSITPKRHTTAENSQNCCLRSEKDTTNRVHLNSQATSEAVNVSYQDSTRSPPPEVVHALRPTHEGSYPPYNQQQTCYDKHSASRPEPRTNTEDPVAVIYAELAPSSRQLIVTPSETVYGNIASA
jgi:hypothetical protein